MKTSTNSYLIQISRNLMKELERFELLDAKEEIALKQREYYLKRRFFANWRKSIDYFKVLLNFQFLLTCIQREREFQSEIAYEHWRAKILSIYLHTWRDAINKRQVNFESYIYF